MDVQRTVYEAVKARGYVDGWTPGQFVARQIAKLVEEVAEAALYVCTYTGWSPPWLKSVGAAGDVARCAFDDRSAWSTMGVRNVEAMKAELEDVVVVAMCAAQALAEHSGEPFDVVAGALGKAVADVERGKR